MELKNSSLFKEKGFINGKWVSAENGKTYDVTNPADNSLVAKVPSMGKTETNEAIQAAAKSFLVWRDTPAKQRATILLDWYNLVIANKEELAKIMVLEQGKPLAEAIGETVYAANFIQWFAEQSKRILGNIMSDFAKDTTLQYTKEAVGVVGVITPWNFPLAMITRKAAPALAAGCSVVIKPSRNTPLCALALVELAHQAGVPAGVLNLITGEKSTEIGDALCESKQVRKISFTGSTTVGKLLLQKSANSVKRMSMELGGNAAFIVFDDADFSRAVDSLMASKFRNTGQTCVCANRIFVQAEIYESFIEALKEKVIALKVGNGLEEGVQQGPLINKAAVEKVENHVQSAVSQGAEVVLGGKPHSLGGSFYQPTILKNVQENSIFKEEETFGPVAPLIRFETEEEVIKMANDTEYGLANYFFTQDFRRIQRVNRELESGIICINEGIFSNEFGPFGGVKESGIGREGSVLGIEEYLETKYTLISYK